MNFYTRPFILITIFGLLNACSGHKSAPNTSVNPEIIGSWSNDSRCTATFIKENETLILTKFNNSTNTSLESVRLASLKESIFSKFKAEDANIKFSGMFTEGQIIIDGYCKEALHKVDSH